VPSWLNVRASFGAIRCRERRCQAAEIGPEMRRDQVK
jgi:hypothetical protein